MSYRSILRSSYLIGGASAVNMITGIAKMKVAALVVGPGGLGLIGLLQNFMQLSAQLAALGVANAGTRKVAVTLATGDIADVVRVRHAIIVGSLVQAAIAVGAIVLLRGEIARLIGLEPEQSVLVGWLSLGIALTIGGGAQGAVLAGLRRVGDIARIQLFSGLASAAVGIPALYLLGDVGIIVLVVALPLASFLLGLFYVARLKEFSAVDRATGSLWDEWRGLVGFGSAFMVSMLVTQGGHLVVRSLVLSELGSAGLGHFQAAWALGMMYLTFVLTAMGTDYYPRLSAAIENPAVARKIVNQQSEVAVLLCGPVIVALLALAPWVVRLLYSEAFLPAVSVLRWQLMGDVFKILSWPIGFVIIARGAGRSLIATEAISSSAFVLGVYLLLPVVGLDAVGMAFVGYYVIHLCLVWVLGGRHIGLRWDTHLLRLILTIAVSALATSLIGSVSDLGGAAIGLALATSLGIYSLMRFASVLNETGRLARLLRFARMLSAGMARKDRS